MKKIAIAVALVAAVGFTGSAFAQGFDSAQASAAAKAEIIIPIGIDKVHDLDFGQIVLGAGGTVLMNVANGNLTADGVTLGHAAAFPRAEFTVTGEGSNTYSISLPQGPVTITGGTLVVDNTMTVSDFTSLPLETGTLDAGTQTLYVAGTLNVAAIQDEGAYTGNFNVSVAYN